MGTSAVSIALAAIAEQFNGSAVLLWAARVILIIALIMLVAVVTINVLRWVNHRKEALSDLRHPVKGGMTATLAGAMLTVAVAMGRVGAGFLPDGLVTILVVVLTVVGAVLALLIGWEFLAEVFTSEGVPLPQVAGTWFIPPVVTIIVPLALLPLVVRYPGSAAGLMALGWAMLGIGTVLYLVLTAVLFIRTVNHPLPPAGLAPSLIIGMGPAGLIGLDIVRMVATSVDVGLLPQQALPMSLLVATMFWGFGAWWLISALLVLRRGYQSLPFSLAWWGFIFPVGAWTIATIVLGAAWQTAWMQVLGILAVTMLVVLWGYVVARTLIGMRKGTIWSH